jgi:hypothetical protein
MATSIASSELERHEALLEELAGYQKGKPLSPETKAYRNKIKMIKAKRLSAAQSLTLDQLAAKFEKEKGIPPERAMKLARFWKWVSKPGHQTSIPLETLSRETLY